MPRPNAQDEETASEGAQPPARRGFLNRLGPGLITGAADDDPSGIATYTQAGAQFGYGMGWTLLLTYPLMVGIQLASARIGRTTGRGLTSAFATLWPRPVVLLAVLLLLVANVVNLAADIGAMAEVARLGLGGPEALYALGFGLLSLALQAWLPYHRYVRVLKWLTLSLLAYVGVALVAHVDWKAALAGALLPRLHGDAESIKMVVAILGTTISPYLFFWQAAQEVEEIERIPGDHALRTHPAQARAQLRRLRLDTWVGMGFSNAIAFSMIVASAATLHAHGQTDVSSTAQDGRGPAPGGRQRGLRAVRAGDRRHRPAGAAGARRFGRLCLRRVPARAPRTRAAGGRRAGLLRHPRGRHGLRHRHQPVRRRSDEGARVGGGAQFADVGADHGRRHVGRRQPPPHGRTGAAAALAGAGLGRDRGHGAGDPGLSLDQPAVLSIRRPRWVASFPFPPIPVGLSRVL
jgi:hypothetical protein